VDLLRRGRDLKPRGLADIEGTASPAKESGDLFEANFIAAMCLLRRRLATSRLNTIGIFASLCSDYGFCDEPTSKT
jgi:hypothetical protein